MDPVLDRDSASFKKQNLARKLQDAFPKTFQQQNLLYRTLLALKNQSTWWNRSNVSVDFLDMARACPSVRLLINAMIILGL